LTFLDIFKYHLNLILKKLLLNQKYIIKMGCNACKGEEKETEEDLGRTDGPKKG
jgi:hypothetical protein